MNIRPIKSKDDYEWSLARINELMDTEPNSNEEAELDILATLVDVYESRNFPIESPDPIEAILFRMEQQGLDRKDLNHIFGSRGRTSEVFSKKRSLSIEMIRKLNTDLQIPLESLIK